MVKRRSVRPRSKRFAISGNSTNWTWIPARAIDCRKSKRGRHANDGRNNSMNAKCGLTVLRFSLGIVVLIEAVMFVMPGAAHAFTRTHMPGFVRLVLGFGEI